MLVAPLPKFQSQRVMLPVDWSLNFTDSGAGPRVGAALKRALTRW